MNIKQTKAFALSLAVATPTLMQTVPVTAASASAELTPISSNELVYNPHMDDGSSALLGALMEMSADEKLTVGGNRIVLAGNFAAPGVAKKGCLSKGVFCRGGKYSNGCPCKILHGATQPAG